MGALNKEACQRSLISNQTVQLKQIGRHVWGPMGNFNRDLIPSGSLNSSFQQ
jgi:hypothetical protein